MSSDGYGREPGRRAVSILVADDDPAMRSLVSDELQDEGYRVFQVSNGREALEGLAQFQPGLVITDLRMPYAGMSLVPLLKAIAPRTPVILITAFGDKDTESLAHKWGASAYFNKPVRMAELKEAVKHLLESEELPKTTNGRKERHGE